MKTKATLAALVALAASAYPAYPSSSPRDPVSVSQFTCKVPAQEDPEQSSSNAAPPVRYSIGTTTRVGSLEVTASHVVTNCENPPEGVVVLPKYDLAFLKVAPTSSCRKPELGQLVIFHGYPGTKPDGSKITDRGEWVYEGDPGAVYVNDVPFIISVGADGKLAGYLGHSRAYVEKVRPGYSGGAVTDANTGEFLGVISTISHDGTKASFVPASIICQELEALL